MAKLSPSLKIVTIDISDLNPAPYNPRKWSKAAIESLKESLKRFGFVDPLIVNGSPSRKNIVIGGHFRLKVAKELGYKEVPVVYVNIPNLKKEKELNLRLNRNTGEWDFEILKEFDIGSLLDVGFDNTDLSNIWDNALETEDDGFDVEKELKKISKPKTKPGDIYQLGRHRLICGDSTDPAIVQKVVGENKIDMLYCDPPYNIGLSYDKGVATKGKYGGKTNDKKSDEDYGTFLQQTLNNGLKTARADCHVFYWCDERYISLVQEKFGAEKVNLKRLCLWIKNNQNLTPQIAFNKAFETCIYGIRGKPYISPTLNNIHGILNKEVTTGNRIIDDIMDLFNIWLAKRMPGHEYEHPTEKPPTLHEKPLRRCTKPGDKVLDLFGGSGSTLIACEQLKRTAYLVEIEPIFCDLIINRYEKLSNQKAKKLN